MLECGKYGRRRKLTVVDWLSVVVAGTGLLGKGGGDDHSDEISKLDLESPSSLKFDELEIVESVTS